MVTVVLANKTATRLPESTSFGFEVAGCSWSSMTKLGSRLDPGKVQLGGSRRMHNVEAIECSSSSSGGGGLRVTPYEGTLVAFGQTSAFPTPLRGDVELGASANFILHNNLWNTNYVMW